MKENHHVVFIAAEGNERLGRNLKQMFNMEREICKIAGEKVNIYH